MHIAISILHHLVLPCRPITVGDVVPTAEASMSTTTTEAVITTKEDVVTTTEVDLSTASSAETSGTTAARLPSLFL